MSVLEEAQIPFTTKCPKCGQTLSHKFREADELLIAICCCSWRSRMQCKDSVPPSEREAIDALISTSYAYQDALYNFVPQSPSVVESRNLWRAAVEQLKYVRAEQ